MTERQVNKFFRPYFNRLGITTWNCEKFKSKGCAIVTVLDVSKAQQFLRIHGQSHQGRQDVRSVRQPIFHANRHVTCSPSKTQPDSFLTSSLEREEREKQTKVSVPTPRNTLPNAEQTPRAYDLNHLWCGQWDYQGNELVFSNYYQSDRQGRIVFDSHGLFIQLRSSTLHHASDADNQLEIHYKIIESYTTGSPEDPSLTFSLRVPPKIFEQIDEVSSKLRFSFTTLSRRLPFAHCGVISTLTPEARSELSF